MALETGLVIFTAALVGVIALLAGLPAALAGAPQIPPAWQFAALGLAAAIAPIAGIRILARWRPGPLKRLLAGQAFAMPPASTLREPTSSTSTILTTTSVIARTTPTARS